MTCEFEGCQKAFTHATQKSAEHALNIHKWRVHRTRLTSAVPVGATKAPVAKLTSSEQVELDRRSKAWRQAHPDKAKRIGNRNPRTVVFTGKAKSEDRVKLKVHEKAPTTQTVNFCPCCGCNIQKVAMGMILTQKL